MADYRADTEIAASARRTFDFLSDVSNLPLYFDRMTAAHPGEGETVQTTAQLPDGREVEAEAWFHVDQDAMSLAWGAEGPHDYHGHLEVAGDGDRSTVTVTVSTARVESDQIQRGLEQTLANITRLAQAGDGAPR